MCCSMLVVESDLTPSKVVFLSRINAHGSFVFFFVFVVVVVVVSSTPAPALLFVVCWKVGRLEGWLVATLAGRKARLVVGWLVGWFVGWVPHFNADYVCGWLSATPAPVLSCGCLLVGGRSCGCRFHFFFKVIGGVEVPFSRAL